MCIHHFGFEKTVKSKSSVGPTPLHPVLTIDIIISKLNNEKIVTQISINYLNKVDHNTT